MPTKATTTAPTALPNYDTFCAKHELPDGIHSVKGCVSFYYSCTGGHSTRVNCPVGLYYDSELYQCANRASIPKCGGQRPEPTTTTVAADTQPTTPPDMWCQNHKKSDGIYASGCSSYFYSCTGGFSTRLDCPSGHYYDPEQGECNLKEYIPKCGGKRLEQTTASPTVSTAAPDTYCRDHRLKDGLHAAGCYSYFYSCSEGSSVRLTCPNNLYYDPEIEQCVSKKFVPICGGSRPLPTTTQAPEQQPTAPVDTFCQVNKLSDGLHGVHCNSFFYACNSGYSTKLYCPSGLYFDVKVNECTNRSWIKACGGKRPPTTTTQQPQQNPTQPPNLWCRTHKKTDGIHSEQGCVNYFYLCGAGYTNTIACPPGLFYDAELQQCNDKHLIVACGGKKPVSTTPAVDVPVQPIVSYGEPVSVARNNRYKFRSSPYFK